MNYKLKKHGFSLAEVMMASAILAVGLLMIAGTFPVAIFLMSGSVEQSIAPIVADEAFAKIQLYGVNVSTLLPPATTTCADFSAINNLVALAPPVSINASEYLYPSANGIPDYDRAYSWSAL